jgi:hypothetical protein
VYGLDATLQEVPPSVPGGKTEPFPYSSLPPANVPTPCLLVFLSVSVGVALVRANDTTCCQDRDDVCQKDRFRHEKDPF